MRTEQGIGASHHPMAAASFELPPAAATAFEAIQVTTTYPSGAVLFVEGETPRGVFVLLSGRVKLSIGSASGKVIILRIARPGEILGLHAAVSAAVFKATAQTVEPCRVSFVRRDEFLRFLRNHPQAALEAARQLSDSYQEACDQLRSIGLCESARQKVARFVLEWSEQGETREDGVRSTLTLTHEEIGQLIGTSRETVTRALGDFRTSRWIMTRGSTLVVQNMRALKDLAGGDAGSSCASETAHAATGAGLGYLGARSPFRLAESRL